MGSSLACTCVPLLRVSCVLTLKCFAVEIAPYIVPCCSPLRKEVPPRISFFVVRFSVVYEHTDPILVLLMPFIP